AFDVFHHQEQISATLQHVVNTSNMFIVKLRRAFGLLQQASTKRALSTVLAFDSLDSHRPLQDCVIGEEHFAHPTVSQFRPDNKPANTAAEQISNCRCWLRHKMSPGVLRTALAQVSMSTEIPGFGESLLPSSWLAQFRRGSSRPESQTLRRVMSR